MIKVGRLNGQIWLNWPIRRSNGRGSNAGGLSALPAASGSWTKIHPRLASGQHL